MNTAPHDAPRPPGRRDRLPATWREHWRLILVACACAALAAAALRPGIRLPARVGSYLLAIDITQSMNVADAGIGGEKVSRLEAARRLASEAVRRLPCGNQAGVAVFTERKTMVLLAPVEVCAHFAAIDDALDHIDWRMAWAADSHLYYGVISALDEIERHLPGTALAFFTDGHQAPALFPGREPKYARTAASPHGVIFGLGGAVPQPVPKFDDQGRIAGYWTAEDAAAFASTGGATLSVLDMERMAAGEDVRNAAQRPGGAGAEHLSGRHDALIESLAQGIGLSHALADDPAAVVRALSTLPSSRVVPVRRELHPLLAALGAMLLLASLIPGRLLRRARAPKEHAGPPAGRPFRLQTEGNPR